MVVVEVEDEDFGSSGATYINTYGEFGGCLHTYAFFNNSSVWDTHQIRKAPWTGKIEEAFSQ